MDSNNESPLLRYSISCTNIPEALLNKVIAKQHFGQFGKVATMYLRPQQMSCTIDYVDKESAEEAIEYGGEYDGVLFDINWASSKKKQSKVVDPDWLPDPEIQSELDALEALVPSAPRQSRQQSMIIDLTGPDVSNKKSKKQLVKPKKVNVKPQKSSSDIDTKTVATKAVNFENIRDILATPAFTAEQRYRVLDARDQLIRLQTSNEPNVKTGHTKGVCPDMCPEKERLMREFQHQIAQYEQEIDDPRSMDHSIAVKQYSRSSADQETPLPHELRPVPVLQRTMAYLLQKIVGLSEEDDVNLNDWYHFVWDRMRSIRKDITQQELCCTGSVNLVEQCARFHIHCAARLVGEDASVFDQRINTENLTKCLQSLKYMYHDLAKNSIICANEAEFRAYIILLNLNDCNFMWEVQRWSTAIQKSSQVKFAIKVFLALDSNNYVKFFKLVQETTYLNACILLRYFNQVRSRAIGTIMKSYVARVPTNFPLSDLTDILAFEDVEQCAQFLDHYGLNCNTTDGSVYLDKQMFIEPDYPYHLQRCLNVIESKRSCSVGEAIYGEAMQETNFSTHLPHCSFDEEGYLTKEAMNAEDQNYLKEGKKIEKKPDSTVSRSNMFSRINPAPDVQKPIEKHSNIDMLDGNKTLFGNRGKDTSSTGKGFIASSNLFSKTSAPSATKSIFSNSNSNSAVAKNNFFAKTTESTTLFSSNTDIFKNAQTKPANIFGGNQTVFNLNSGSNIFFNNEVGTTKQSKSIFTPATTVTNIFGPKPVVEEKRNSALKFEPTTPVVTNSLFSFGNAASSPAVQQQSSFTKSQSSSPGGFSFSLAPASETRTISSKAQDDAAEKEMLRKKQEEEAKMEAIRKQKEEEEKRKREEIIERCNKQAAVMCDDILDEEIRKMCSAIAQDEFKNYTKMSENAMQITEGIIADLIDEICREEIESEILIHEQLQNIQLKAQERITEKYFYLWLQNVLIKKLKRKAVEETPVWIPARTVKEEAEHLYRSNQDLALENILNYKLSCTSSLLPVNKPMKKIDIFDIVYENVITACQHPRPRSKAYWKLVMSLPDEIESSYWAKYMDNWINYAFQDTVDCNDRDQLILNEYVDTRFSASLALSCRKTIGCRDFFDDMLGANGLVFFALNMEFSVSRMKDRLMKILQYRDKPKIPLVVVYLLVSKTDCKDVESAFDISLLTEAGLVGNHRIIYSDDHSVSKLHELVTEAMEWLSKQHEPDPPLEMDSFESFTYNCLGSELIRRFMIAAAHNYVMRKSFMDPNFIIDMYNNAVEICVEMLSEESLSVYKDFAPELKQFLPKPLHTTVTYEYFPLDWRDVKEQCKVRSIVKNFQLPRMYGLETLKDFMHLESILTQYCSKVLSRDRHEKVAAKMLCVALRFVNGGQDTCAQLQNMSWIDMMEVLVREFVTERLSRILSKHSNLYVIYNKNSMADYLYKPWWLKSKQFRLNNRASQDNFRMVQEDDSFNNKRPKLDLNTTTTDEFDRSISRALETLDNFDKYLDKTTTVSKEDLEHKYDKLNSTVQKQKSKLYAFNKILDQTVKSFR